MSVVATAPCWATEETVPCVDALPNTATVVVVGAGLAGTATALFLAEAGFAPLVVEAHTTIGAGVSVRHSGIALPLLADTPHRLIGAVGLDTARDLVGFAQRGLAVLRDLELLDSTGVLLAASLPQERDAHSADCDATDALGITATAWSPDEVAQRSGTTGFGPGIWIPDAGRIDPGTASTHLARRAQGAGARFAVDTTVTGLTADNKGQRVQTTRGEVRCDVVVLATNSCSAQVDPWFEDKTYPVRTQLVSWGPTADPLPFPIRSQLGYATLEPTPAGRLVAGGCRWATPHLEVGEADDTAISPDVHDKICAMAALHVPWTATASHDHAWSGIMGFTCDGLPIIGPIPGRSRVLCCLGFGGHQATLGVGAARAIVDGLVLGDDGGVPALCTGRRFT